MNELALFSGAGGGILGTHLLGFRPVCAIEIEPYCREVLLRRQEEKILPPFPIWDDATTFDGNAWRGIVDVITAGFPCQPFSAAGKGLGEHDPRNLWPETIRIIREVEPAFCLLENVPVLTSKEYFGRILGDLSEAGFNAEWDVISAASIGANHIRKRLWILAYANVQRLQERAAEAPQDTEARHESMVNEPCGKSWWETEPAVCRVVDGLAFRADRIKAIGNGQVPGVVVKAWRMLLERSTL